MTVILYTLDGVHELFRVVVNHGREAFAEKQIIDAAGGYSWLPIGDRKLTTILSKALLCTNRVTTNDRVTIDLGKIKL